MSDPKRPADMDEATIAALYERDALELPPQSLDDAVLAAARAEAKAMRANGEGARHPHHARLLTRRWPAALASAAVLMLTIAVLFQAELPYSQSLDVPAGTDQLDHHMEVRTVMPEKAPAPASALNEPASVPQEPANVQREPASVLGGLADLTSEPVMDMRREESVSFAEPEFELAHDAVLASVQPTYMAEKMVSEQASTEQAASKQAGTMQEFTKQETIEQEPIGQELTEQEPTEQETEKLHVTAQLASLASKRAKERSVPAEQLASCEELSRGICRIGETTHVKMPECEMLTVPRAADKLMLDGDVVRYQLAEGPVDLVCRQGAWVAPSQPSE